MALVFSGEATGDAIAIVARASARMVLNFILARAFAGYGVERWIVIDCLLKRLERR
jgi:hypothetical protein